MIEIIESIASIFSAYAGWVTFIGIGVIVYVALDLNYRLFSRGSFSMSQRATLSTSIGIFFTFLGISVGLIVFDTANIDSSVNDLINGLQIAFLTSLVGVLCATILKFLIKKETKHTQQAGGQTDNELLQKISKSLDSLNKNLYGEEDGSLIGQIKILKNDNKDNNDKLVGSINAFAEKVAKNQTEELVKALENVLQNLEQTIQEKLGESFKQFSKSVENLVKWQEGYKDNIEQTQKILNQVKISMSETSTSFDNIAKQNKQAQEVQENLKEIIKTLFEQLKSVQEQTETLSKIPDTFTSIASNINTIGQDMEKTTQNVATQMEATAAAHQAEMEKIVTSLASGLDGVKQNMEESARKHMILIQEIIKDIQSKSGEVNTQYDTLIKNIQDQIPKLTTELDNHLARTVTGFRSTIENAHNELRQTLNNNNG